MITSINQINFGHKLKTIFLENHNQWQNVSTDKRPSLNILSRFYSTMASKLKKSTHLLTDFTWRYTAKSPPKTTKTFKISVYFSIIRAKRVKNLARNPPVLTTYLLGY